MTAKRLIQIYVYGIAMCFAVGCLAAFGWGRHWNAYTNLALTFGDCVLWVTWSQVVQRAAARRDEHDPT